MTRAIGAIFALILLASSVGCGGSDSASLTKAGFVKQARVVCHEGKQKKEEVLSSAILKYQEGEKAATPKMQEKAVLEVVEPYEKTTEKLADLGLPEGGKNKVEALIRAREEAIETVKADPVDALKSIKPFAKALKMTKEFGLKMCDI